MVNLRALRACPARTPPRDVLREADPPRILDNRGMTPALRGWDAVDEPVRSTLRRSVEQALGAIVTALILVVLSWLFTPVKDVLEPTAYAAGLHDRLYPDRSVAGRWAALPAGDCTLAVRIALDGKTITMTAPDGRGGQVSQGGSLGEMSGERWIMAFDGDARLQLKREGGELHIRAPNSEETVSEYQRCD